MTTNDFTATLINIEEHGPDAARLAASVGQLLKRTELCTMATITAEGKPYANTCFFAVTPDLTLLVLTPPRTVHARNLAERPAISVTVFDGAQKSGSELQGLQLFGTCRQAREQEIPACLANYGARFPGVLEVAPDVSTFLIAFESRFFIIRVDCVKIFDEPSFGKETWIEAQVER